MHPVPPASEAPESLDLRHLKCPLPVLRTRRALDRMAPGRVIVVLCTDPLATLDLPNLLRETGDTLEGFARDESGARFTIRRTGHRPGEDQIQGARVDPQRNGEAS